MGLRVRGCWVVLLLALGLGFGKSGLPRQRRQSEWWRGHHQSVPRQGSSRWGGVAPVFGFGGSRGGAPLGSSSRQMPQAGGPPVAVQCTEDSMVISVQRNFYRNGRLVNPNDLSLGPQRCQPTTESTDPILFQVGLQDCGNDLQMTPDWMIYSTNLTYKPTTSANVPITRMSPAVIPIHCYYTRHGNVSSKAVQPTWIPYSTTVSYEERLNFSLTLMEGDWSGPRYSTLYQLGEIIHIQASVDIQNHMDMILFVDSCVATLSPDASSSPRYEIINANGCLVDGTQPDSSSAFISPRFSLNTLRFTFPSFIFMNSEEPTFYVTCQLRAAPATQVPNSMNKACSYSKTTQSWSAVEGPSSICQCCSTGSCSSRSGGSRYWGSFESSGRWMRNVGPQEEYGEASLGPILVIEDQPASKTELSQGSKMSRKSKPVGTVMLVAVASISLVLVSGVVSLIGKCVVSRLFS